MSSVQNVEAAFADVHRKYERTKQVSLTWNHLSACYYEFITCQVVEGFKKNEEQLKHYVAEYKTKLKNQDQVSDCPPPSFCGSFSNSQLSNYRHSNFQRYDLLKAHAEEKLEEANKEIDNISRGQVGLGFWIYDELFLAFYRMQRLQN